MALAPASLEMNTVTEELIYNLAELPNRLKKFGEGLTAVGDFFINQFKNSYWGQIADVVSRIASGGQVGFSQAFDETYNTGAGQEAVNRLREARSKLATQPELQRKEETEKIIAPMVTTANNTKKLVELQQKQVDLSTQMLGGGTTAANAASPVRLGQAMSGRGGGGRGNVNYHIEQVVRAIMEQTMGLDVAAVRNSGTPNRLGVR